MVNRADQSRFSRVAGLLLAAGAVGLLGCDTSQVLTGSTADPGFVPDTAAAGSGGTGGAAGSGPVGTGGSSNAGPPQLGAVGGAGGALPEPGGPAPHAQIVGCVDDPIPSSPAEIVACGLSPNVDVVAVDESGVVLSRRSANGLVRVDRGSGALTTLDPNLLGLGNGGRATHPVRGSELFAARGAEGPIEAIHLVTGAHRTIAPSALGLGLALGTNELFFQTAGTGVLTAAPLIGDVAAGAPLAGDFVLSPRAVDGDYVYGDYPSGDPAKGDDVYRILAKGGALERVHGFEAPQNDFGGAPRPHVWTVADGSLYWVENGGFLGTHRVLGRPVGGGETRVYAVLPDQECDCAPTVLRASANRLSFVFYGGIHVSAVSRPDLAPVNVFGGYMGSGTYAIHDGFVYAATARGGFDAPEQGLVRRAPLPALPAD